MNYIQCEIEDVCTYTWPFYVTCFCPILFLAQLIVAMCLENSLKIKKCLRIKYYLTSVIIEDNAKYQMFFQILNCSFFSSIKILIHFHINVGIMVIFQKLINVGPCLFQILEYFACTALNILKKPSELE